MNRRSRKKLRFRKGQIMAEQMTVDRIADELEGFTVEQIDEQQDRLAGVVESAKAMRDTLSANKITECIAALKVRKAEITDSSEDKKSAAEAKKQVAKNNAAERLAEYAGDSEVLAAKMLTMDEKALSAVEGELNEVLTDAAHLPKGHPDKAVVFRMLAEVRSAQKKFSKVPGK